MSHILEIRKRTGQVVTFDPTKINRAVEKAFYAVTNDPHQREADLVARTVVDRLAGRADAMGESYVPSVEEVQDIVEQSIMQQGFFDVAKSYIVYRYEHQKTRVEEQKVVQEKIQNREFVITAEDGTAELFPPERIHSFFTRAARGYEGIVAVHALVEQAQKELFEGMTARDVVHTLVLVARSFVEQDPAYSIIASRLLLEGIVYVDAFGSVPADMHALHARYREAFKEMVQYGVEHKMLDEHMLTFDLEKLSAAIQPERDDLLRYLGTQTLFDRYFLRDKASATHRFIETPQYMWMRIAMGLALGEDNKEERAISFYNLMSELRYLPSTPTLFNAGTTYSQLSSCFLGVVADDLHSIFKTYEDYAHMARHSGGVAYSWTKLRATGANVKSAGGAASNGPIPFLKVLDSTVVAINRSGRRRGACCVYLEPWHYDVEEFIELRKNTGDERRRTHDLNTALWMPDLFMKRIRENADWTLFSPDETPDLPETYGAEFERRYVAYERAADEGTIKLFKRMKARELWKKILTQLFETGHPWITFKDASNVRSPQDHVGVIHNSNLCTEITLNNEPDKEVAVCNLGSINLGEHIVDGVLSEDRIKETVLAAVRMLDNVIDLNFYPIVETRNSNLRHRPIGLGLMGFQDALYKLGYNFDSEEAVQFADRSMEVISYYAILASSNLAKERGTYQTFKGSKWDRNIFPVDTLALLEKDRGEAILVDRTESMDWSVVRENVQKYGMRNSNVMAMAPTATISNIAGCFPTIEPVYKNIYVKANISGTFIVMNDYLIEDLKKEGLWNHELLEVIKGHEGDLTHISLIPQWIKDRYKEVFLIDQQWLIKAAAARGKWIDQSQSLNIFYSGTSGAELANIYTYAWQAGLKTTYYLRSLGASAIEQSTVSLDKQQNLDKREAETLAAVAVAEIKEELVAQEPKPKFEMASVSIHKTAELKLCKIDDPSCESCQ